MKYYLVEGPLMNRVDQRDANHYGTAGMSRDDMLHNMKMLAESNGVEFDSFQSDIEGEIVSFIASLSDADGLIVNVAGYTHTSVAIRDVLEMRKLPVVECHLSRLFDREDFRKNSLINAVATGVISGLGFFGYELSLRALMNLSAE
ncbi:type II 3-dehydroquinate dehydratase [bacterium]|nr:type II 3-dehydroquinate dehydratase [bacterium]